MNKRKIYNGIILILIAALVVLLYFNFRGNKVKLSENDKMVFVGKEHLIVVYEDKLALDVPFAIQATKETTFGELVEKKEYEEMLRRLNDILPEKVEKYAVVKYGELQYDVENAKKIPETSIEEKRYALSSAVYSLFNEMYGNAGKTDETYQNLIVDVLNANGRGGYARKTGEMLTQKLSVKYNAANYEKNLDESYIILNDISLEKAQEIVMSLPEKYFVIKEKPVIPTLANLVIVLGKENTLPVSISVLGEDAKLKEASTSLKKAGYTSFKTENAKASEKAFIEYEKEDYFIAYKLAQVLGIQNMVVKDTTSNKIEIHL